MPELKNIEITEISLVDKPANGTPFCIIKMLDPKKMPDPQPPAEQMPKLGDLGFKELAAAVSAWVQAMKFDPSQERDESGKWTDGGAGGEKVKAFERDARWGDTGKGQFSATVIVNGIGNMVGGQRTANITTAYGQHIKTGEWIYQARSDLGGGLTPIVEQGKADNENNAQHALVRATLKVAENIEDITNRGLLHRGEPKAAIKGEVNWLATGGKTTRRFGES